MPKNFAAAKQTMARFKRVIKCCGSIKLSSWHCTFIWSTVYHILLMLQNRCVQIHVKNSCIFWRNTKCFLCWETIVELPAWTDGELTGEYLGAFFFKNLLRNQILCAQKTNIRKSQTRVIIIQEHKGKSKHQHWNQPHQMEFLCFYTLYLYIFVFGRVNDSCLLKALGCVQFICSAGTQPRRL